MLVLSRKLQQQIVIPELNIRITVLSVGTNRVQLGYRSTELNSDYKTGDQWFNIRESSDVRVASGC
jgi:hypothetical protein